LGLYYALLLSAMKQERCGAKEVSENSLTMLNMCCLVSSLMENQAAVTNSAVT